MRVVDHQVCWKGGRRTGAGRGVTVCDVSGGKGEGE